MVWRVYGLTSGAFDLGFIVSALAEINRVGVGAPVSWAGWDLFADHFSPLLVPLARVADTSWGAYWLVLIQAAAFVISTFIARRLIRETVDDQRDRKWMLTAYATAPAILFPVFFDFHASVAALPLLMLTLYGLTTKRTNLAIASSMLMALAREDIALLALVLSVSEARRNPRYTRFVAPAALMCLAGWAVFTYGRMKGRGLFSLYGYLDWRNPLTSATRAVEVIWADGALALLIIALLIPWVLSGSFNPRLLSVLAATSLPYLLADFALMKTVTVHYYVIAPPLLLTAVCQQRPVLTEQRRQWWVAGVMIGVLGGPLVTGLYGPASREVIYPTLRSIHANQQVIQATHDAISCLPEGATIATTSTVTPLVAHLRRVVILPYPFESFSLLTESGPALVPSNAPTTPPEFIVSETIPLSARQSYTRSDWNVVLWGRGSVFPSDLRGCLEGAATWSQK